MLVDWVVILSQVPVQLMDVDVVHDAVEDIPVPVESPSWAVGLDLENVYKGGQWGFMFSDGLEM
jgi:hypothetical protein